MKFLKANTLDGGALGSVVRECTQELHEQTYGDCNRCHKKGLQETDCEVGFFSRHKHGDGHMDAAMEFIKSHRSANA